MVVFTTKTAAGTEKLGRQFGRWLRGAADKEFVSVYQCIDAIKHRPVALVIGLSGDLGSGKTTFIKGLAGGLGIKEKITSPTYVFVRSYEFNPLRLAGQVKDRFYHLDLYRLGEASARPVLDSFEFSEIVRQPSALVAIEWAERLAPGSSKKNWLNLDFKYVDGGRTLTFQY